MKIIRKSIGTILVMGAAAIGCAGDAEPPTQPSSGQSPAARPVGGNPPAVKIGDEGAKSPKGGLSQPPPVTIPAASDDKKKTDLPKLEGPGKADTASKLSADELAEIKKLPKDEQDAALAQAVCPASTHNLGSMGKPVKVTAEGRTFYLCCDSCKDDLKTDAKAVVAKLDKLKAGK